MESDETVLPGRGELATIDVSALEEGDAVTFAYEDRLGQSAEGFLLRWRDQYVAYENRCPHWSVPVGFDDVNFLDGNDIICPMHGARFHPDTGQCWSGPCLGDGLEKFVVTLDGDFATVRRQGLSLKLI